MQKLIKGVLLNNLYSNFIEHTKNSDVPFAKSSDVFEWRSWEDYIHKTFYSSTNRHFTALKELQTREHSSLKFTENCLWLELTFPFLIFLYADVYFRDLYQRITLPLILSNGCAREIIFNGIFRDKFKPQAHIFRMSSRRSNNFVRKLNVVIYLFLSFFVCSVDIPAIIGVGVGFLTNPYKSCSNNSFCIFSDFFSSIFLSRVYFY